MKCKNTDDCICWSATLLPRQPFKSCGCISRFGRQLLHFSHRLQKYVCSVRSASKVACTYASSFT